MINLVPFGMTAICGELGYLEFSLGWRLGYVYKRIHASRYLSVCRWSISNIIMDVFDLR
jgi:hypothetical protein